MESNFWEGIAIGAVLSFAASVAANLCHNQVIFVLDRGKFVSHQHLKKKADRLYKAICELHSGKRDKYLYMLALNRVGVIAIIASSTTMIFAVIVAGPKLGTLGLFELPPWSLDAFYIYVFMFVSFLCMFFAFRVMKLCEEIRRALDDFVNFEEEYHKRWGHPPA
jgi:hypothetical protein